MLKHKWNVTYVLKVIITSYTLYVSEVLLTQNCIEFPTFKYFSSIYFGPLNLRNEISQCISSCCEKKARQLYTVHTYPSVAEIFSTSKPQSLRQHKKPLYFYRASADDKLELVLAYIEFSTIHETNYPSLAFSIIFFLSFKQLKSNYFPHQISYFKKQTTLYLHNLSFSSFNSVWGLGYNLKPLCEF